MNKNKKIKWYFFYLHCWSILYYIYIQQEKKMKKSINENTEKNIEIKATVKAFYKLGISALQVLDKQSLKATERALKSNRRSKL